VTPTQVPQTDAYQFAAGGIAANGTLLPARDVRLSFGVGGRVAAVEVEVGQTVQAGEMLAALDAADLERAVAQVQLELQSAQTRLVQLEADATPVPERVLAATAAISSAQAALTQAQAQAGQRANQETIDLYALEQATRALADAQNAYQKVLDDPWTHGWAPSSDAARTLAEVQDYYDVVLAQYNLHAADRSYGVAIANAEAQLAQAQLALYEAQHPVAPEAVTLAQLDVERAQLALDAAQDALDDATIAAPFDGVVAAVPVSVGEWAAPGSAAVELLDVSRWRVETKNVGELQIGRVQVGQTVSVRVNAFRDQTLNGRVVAISPVAVVQQGDTTYTLMIELDPTDLNLRPGMTAQVQIEVPEP
jgi:HlyD family secretion protein